MFGNPAKYWTICVIVAVSLVAGPAAGDERPKLPAFTAGDQGGYTFDTGILRGTLRQDGKSRGLSSVVHIPSGARLDGSVGIAGHTASSQRTNATELRRGIGPARPSCSPKAAY